MRFQKCFLLVKKWYSITHINFPLHIGDACEKMGNSEKKEKKKLLHFNWVDKRPKLSGLFANEMYASDGIEVLFPIVWINKNFFFCLLVPNKQMQSFELQKNLFNIFQW